MISKETLRQVDFPKVAQANFPEFHGGDRGIRTPNLCDANAALSQLSYIPANSILASATIAGQLGIFLS